MFLLSYNSFYDIFHLPCAFLDVYLFVPAFVRFLVPFWFARPSAWHCLRESRCSRKSLWRPRHNGPFLFPSSAIARKIKVTLGFVHLKILISFAFLTQQRVVQNNHLSSLFYLIQRPQQFHSLTVANWLKYDQSIPLLISYKFFQTQTLKDLFIYHEFLFYQLYFRISF